jgi:hypothetical protein
MRCPELLSVAQQMQGLEDLKEFVEGTVNVSGTSVPRLDMLVDQEKAKLTKLELPQKTLPCTYFIAPGSQMTEAPAMQPMYPLHTMQIVNNGRFHFIIPGLVQV